MQQDPEKSDFTLSKYLNKIEIVGWLLFICSMMTIIFTKQLSPAILPYGWVGAIVGALLLGWGMGLKRK
jgi:hypothetical protein